MSSSDTATPLRVESPAVGVVRRGLANRMALASIAVIVCACIVGVSASSQAAMIAMLVAALGAPLAIGGMALAGWLDARRPGALAFDGGVLSLERAGGGATRRYALADLAAGFSTPSTNRLVLRLRSGDEIRAEVGHAPGQALLHALRLDAEHRALTVPLRPMVGTPVRLMMGGMAGFFVALVAFIAATTSLPGAPGAVIAALLLLPPILGVAATARWFRAPDLIIGADGIAVRGVRRRFVPYAQIAEVVPSRSYVANGGYLEGISVRLRNGQTLRLPMFGRSEGDLDAVLSRIAAAMKSSRGTEGASAFALLEPNGRRVEPWKRDLAALLRAPESYRTINLSLQDLLAAVDDARAPATRRIAAALALRTTGHAEAPERIRIAAAASASEPVRVALERIADDALDDDALAQALRSERTDA